MPIRSNCCERIIECKGVFTFLTALLKPKSSAACASRLPTSADPRAWPIVQLGYLSNPEDHVVVCHVIRLAVQVHVPGYPVKDLQVPETENDADFDRFIRTNLRTSSYHYSACCMAREAAGGMLGDELRVYCLPGLRVYDTLVFPKIVLTHTMAPAVVIAEKCVDLVKAA